MANAKVGKTAGMNSKHDFTIRQPIRKLFLRNEIHRQFLNPKETAIRNSTEKGSLLRFFLYRRASIFIVIGCLFLPSCPSFAVTEEIVTGRAAASDQNARKAALQSAFRAAIEKNVGIQVSSDTIVKNAKVLKDEIYTYAEGYVSSWDIIEENVLGSDMVLRVRVTVRDGRLNKALFLNGLNVNKVYSWVGEPRVLILAREAIDGQSTELPYVQSALEEAFLEKGIQVIDSGQLQILQQRDRDLSGDDPKAALALGKRLGTEMVVTATAQANFSRAIPIGNFTLNFYTADMVVRAYNTATGMVLHSGRYRLPDTEDTSAMGKRDAAGKAIRQTVAMAGPDILFKIVSTWYDGFSRPTNFQIVVNNLNYNQLSELKAYLVALSGMRRVIERSYGGGAGELDVRYEGLGDSLIQEILASGAPLSVQRKEQNRMILRYE